MNVLIAPLVYAGQHGRKLLMIGLIAGVTLPVAADVLKGWLPELVALLLFLAALRVGPKQTLGCLQDLKSTFALMVIFQALMPVVMIGFLTLIGLIDSQYALPLVLVLSAPAVSSSPSLTLMTGHDPAPALRLMMLGTALLPITAILPFSLLPEVDSVSAVFTATTRLLLVIFVAVGLAFVVRSQLLPNPGEASTKAIDGANAIAMSIVVAGLMAAVGPAFLHSPTSFMLWLVIAFTTNYGLQFMAYQSLRHSPLKDDRAGHSIIAGNRNIALFLVALDPNIVTNLLLFIGCYRIPMFLVPIFLRRFYTA